MSTKCNHSDRPAPDLVFPNTIGLVDETPTKVTFVERWRPRCEVCATHFTKRSEAPWAVVFADCRETRMTPKWGGTFLCKAHKGLAASRAKRVVHVPHV